ncbi:MAG: phage major capsid protein [Elusimicrobiaceae bacterium]|jgi:HK97 family phage major capsid protein|nr:phage major capsid protein [Elusimicrobiaceae bacterium]MBT3955138.1 phage major capsid protein [Elusimicrobiaceae bacterium]MBT4007969.1 phage major capsid protein [Elusimicrobiaceae bacterium]MBT4402650.1 phage major capsid protein [Elusimicrobiaceae bacterium]MBT4440323.1 phage major capsid protein [Elusimicrobiaceae bacterium]
MDEIMHSIKDLRSTLEDKIDSCITSEKAERMIENIIETTHPTERKAILPQTQDDVLERFAAFRKSGKNMAEKAWTSEYGRKFGNMKTFLLAAKDRHAFASDSKAVLQEGDTVTAGGGYLVPTDFSNEVISLMNEISPIFQISNVVPMSSWKRQIPKQLTNLSVAWAAEGAARTVSNPTFGQIEQVAKVLATVVKCTDELIRDSAINLTHFLSEIVAEAMALEIERVALIGDVTTLGDPFDGILNTSGATEVSMGGASVTFDDVANLLFSLDETYAKDAVVVLSRDGLSKLMKLKDSNNNYIWQPPAGNTPAKVWNVPYVISSKIPSVMVDEDTHTGGDLTCAIFGRFNKYMLLSPRQELVVKVSQDASNSAGDSAFMLDETWIRFTQALSIDVSHGAAFSYLFFK